MGQSLKQLLAILGTISSFLLLFNYVTANQPVAGREHAVDGMCRLLTERIVNNLYAVGKLLECHIYILHIDED